MRVMHSDEHAVMAATGVGYSAMTAATTAAATAALAKASPH